jgi:hypothetical protein
MPSNQISLSVVLKKKGKYIAQVQSLSLVFAPFDEAEDAFWNAVGERRVSPMTSNVKVVYHAAVRRGM